MIYSQEVIGVKAIDRNGLKVSEYGDWAITDVVIEACLLALMRSNRVSEKTYRYVIHPDLNG